MSNTLVVLWSQLEFWFQKKPKGFYKFLKPCAHRWYREGDSWCEQLRISENTFRKYQAYLCTSYASKTEFDEQSDPFQGKPYACYVDRLRKITVYHRNHSLADALTREKILSLHCASVCVWNNTDLNRNIKLPPKSPLVQKNMSREGGGFLQKIEKESITPQPTLVIPSIDSTAQQMHKIWVEATSEHITTPRLSAHFAQKLLDALKTFFQNSLEKWKAYCEKIASSDFLMGKRGSFQAWLIWIIRGDIIQKVRAGGYGLQVEEVDTQQEIVDFDVKSQEVMNKQVQNLKDKEGILTKLNHLKNNIGPAKYLSWFSDCKIIQDERGGVFDLTQMGRFQKDFIQRHFETLLCQLNLSFKELRS